MKNLYDVLFEGQIPSEMRKLFKGQKQAVDEMMRRAAEGTESEWIAEKGGLEEVLHKSLFLSVKEAEALQGKSMSNWKWGDYHQLAFSHPLSSVEPLNYLFNRKGRIPVGGSSVTVQAAANKDDGTVNHGGSWRFVIDTSNMHTAFHLVGPGQSGHPLSRWYHDQLNDWAEGNYHQTRLDEQSSKNQLVLKP